ncbi:hypothetical protein D3C85_1725990 [compost metagenome]
MDTALPASYLYGSSKHSLLPLSCRDKLAPSHLFYDKAAFHALQGKNVNYIAIILDGQTINNYPNTCSTEKIITQLGTPDRIDQTQDGSSVLIYKDVSGLSRQLSI